MTLRKRDFALALSRIAPEKGLRPAARADLAERSRMPVPASPSPRKLERDPNKSPELTAGGVDASWAFSDSGEEPLGSGVPTPDQDRVDDLGRSVEPTSADDEPLDSAAKIAPRERWELNPASADTADSRVLHDLADTGDGTHAEALDDSGDVVISRDDLENESERLIQS